MIYEEITPDITQHIFRFGKDDGDIYCRCMWARINLDHRTYTMSANTDCGNYTYQWTPTPDSESFLALMCRIEKEYLMGKISSQVFDFEKSKKKNILSVKRWWSDIKKDNQTNKDRQRILSQIKDIEECSEEIFYSEMEQATEYLLDIDSICTEREYRAGVISFADVFCKYLQPILKSKLKSENNK